MASKVEKAASSVRKAFGFLTKKEQAEKEKEEREEKEKERKRKEKEKREPSGAGGYFSRSIRARRGK